VLQDGVTNNALSVELRFRGHLVDREARFPVLYKNEQVGLFVPDLIAFRKIVIDVKTIDNIGGVERGQMLNYLRISKLRVGFILNFNTPTSLGTADTLKRRF